MLLESASGLSILNSATLTMYALLGAGVNFTWVLFPEATTSVARTSLCGFGILFSAPIVEIPVAVDRLLNLL